MGNDTKAHPIANCERNAKMAGLQGPTTSGSNDAVSPLTKVTMADCKSVNAKMEIKNNNQMTANTPRRGIPTTSGQHKTCTGKQYPEPGPTTDPANLHTTCWRQPQQRGFPSTRGGNAGNNQPRKTNTPSEENARHLQNAKKGKRNLPNKLERQDEPSGRAQVYKLDLSKYKHRPITRKYLCTPPAKR